MADIRGTIGDDNLAGTDAADRIIGDRGNDTIDGGGGNDQIDAGEGDDVVSGGAGDDTIRGGRGIDRFTFRAGDGKDIIADLEDGETVEIRGYASAQSITQVGGNVVVVLSTGDQITFQNETLATVQAALLFVDGPPSVVDGTPGDDQLVGTSGADTINGLGGDDSIVGGAGGDTLSGGNGNDVLYSSSIPEAGPGWPDGGSETDALDGGDGDDVIFAGLGDSVDGGTDSNGDLLYITFEGATAGISFDLRLGTQVIAGATITGIERIGSLEGTAFDDYINIESAESVPWSRDQTGIFGMGGNDTLVGGTHIWFLDGGDGDDILDGRASIEGQVLDGGAGDDELTGGIGADTFVGGAGFDTFNFAAGDGPDIIVDLGAGDKVAITGHAVVQSISQPSTDVIVTFSGNDQITFQNATIEEVQSALQFVSGPGPNIINGSAMSDFLTGTTGVDSIFGFEGNDTIEGADGEDAIDGGEGADTISGGTGDDELTGGSGADLFKFQAGDGQDTIIDLTTGDAVEIRGYDSAWSIAQVEDNVVLTLSGDDQITFAEIDLATVQAAISFVQPNETLIGTSGDDVLSGKSGSDSISGLGGNDTLSGGAGSDGIDGGDGNDIISGGRGNDYLTGGSGLDRFKYSTGDGHDVITDLHSGDMVEISGYTTGTLVPLASSPGQPSNAFRLILSETDQITFSNTNLEIVQAALSISLIVPPATESDDQLFGTVEDDVLDGLGGHDIIKGINGDDTLFGGAGNDWLAGGQGADSLDGGIGNDYLNAGNIYPESSFADVDHDILSGGEGDDHLSCGFGDDADGGAGSDWLSLNLGSASAGVIFNMSLMTPGQHVVIAGGTLQNFEKISVLSGSNFKDVITIIGPVGEVYGGGGDDVITVTDANYTIEGGAGNDTIAVFGSGHLDGGTGDDIFIISGVQGVINGGDGNNTVDYRNAAAGMTVNLSTAPQLNTEWLIRITNVNGSAFGDTLKGNSEANILFGAAGNDTLTGGQGNDTLIGGEGADTFNFAAGDGMDTIVDLAAGEKVNITGYTAAQSLTQVGADVVLMLSATDGITFLNTDLATVRPALPFSASTSATEGDDTLTGTDAANAINGLGGNDTIYGLAGNDTLDGGDGADRLDGGLGNDTMKGGAGNDIYFVDSSRDVVTELAGAGYDQVSTTVSLTLAANVEAGLALGSAAVNLTGNALNNVLIGNGAANVLNGGLGDDILDGGAGADAMSGGAGNDLYQIDHASDRITEGSRDGTDQLVTSVDYVLANSTYVEFLVASFEGAVDITGNSLAQTIHGNDDVNILTGLAGNDTLSGNGGDDVLKGGQGNDDLTGGAGADRFVFEVQAGNDRISDFARGTDKIDLDALNLTMANVKLAVSGANMLVNVDANRDGLSDFTITLAGVSALDSSDFIFG